MLALLPVFVAILAAVAAAAEAAVAHFIASLPLLLLILLIFHCPKIHVPTFYTILNINKKAVWDLALGVGYIFLQKLQPASHNRNVAEKVMKNKILRSFLTLNVSHHLIRLSVDACFIARLCCHPSRCRCCCCCSSQ